MNRRVGQLSVGVATVVLTILWTSLAHAGVDLVDSEKFGLQLGGYVQSVSGLQELTYETPDLVADRTGLNSEVLRLELSGQITRDVTFEFHDRLYWSIQAPPSQAGTTGIFGIGVSTPPDRTVDTSTDIIDENGIFLQNDIDRAAVRIYTSAADITVGRQAITWGKSMIFPVADLWSKFSPYELDQSQKRGIDALRVLAYPTLDLELDFVVADRGSLEDLSGGARAGLTLSKVDLWFAGGKFWNEILAMAGVTADLTDFKVRAEVVEPYHLDDEAFRLPRGTAGIDYLSSDWQLTAEYHFNGAGTDDPAEYAEQFQDEVFLRGESYFLGRHYGAASASWTGVDDLSITLTAMTNILDPSVLVAPTLRYDISQNADVSIGAFQGFGEEPTFTPFPAFHSEFGSYGGFYFTQMRMFL